MAEWNEFVPAYTIAKFAREAFNNAVNGTNKLKAHFLSNGANEKSYREALSTIEPGRVFEGRNAKDLANIAHQAQWGDAPVTKEELHHLVSDDESKQ